METAAYFLKFYFAVHVIFDNAFEYKGPGTELNEYVQQFIECMTTAAR